MYKLAKYNIKGDFITFEDDEIFLGKELLTPKNVAPAIIEKFRNRFKKRCYELFGKIYVVVEYRILKNQAGETFELSEDDVFAAFGTKQLAYDFNNFEFWNEVQNLINNEGSITIIGNLHKNPELFY